MDRQLRQASFSLMEVGISLGIVVVLVAVLVPALSAARTHSHLEHCASQQRQLGEIWSLYLADHEDTFPFVGIQPGWHYGGVRYSPVTGLSFLDYQRPLNPYVGGYRVGGAVEQLFCCPADVGITHEHLGVGTGDRTAFRSFGTSYRCNAAVVDARIAGTDGARGLHLGEITTPPSRFVLMGDPVWYETYERTGRDADWHGASGLGNMLFLDGSVRLMSIRPKGERGAAVAEISLRQR